MTKNMTIKKYILLLTIVLIFSTIGIAEENKTKVIAISKDIGIDSASGKYIVLVNIATNKIGHLIYMEEYYSKNSSDRLKLDSRIMYYNDTLQNNTLVLKIKRPLDKNGEQYDYVKAVGFIDNEKILDSWFTYINKNTSTVTENGIATENKKSPGFEIIIPIISILSVTYILKKKIKRG